MTRWRGLGPGVVVTAAFIGPGTVTTATLAGANYGLALIWTLVFATAATIILQEMSARLGLVTRAGLGHALHEVGGPPWLGPSLAWLAVAAVVGGAAAYEAGNLLGAGLGLETVAGLSPKTWSGIAAAVAGVLLWTGRYKIVERALVACVAVMGVVFVATAIVAAPNLKELATGALAPRLPTPDARLAAMGLIGTTIVPYNLFLHAAAVRERWGGSADLPAARWDLAVAIGLGGVVSAAVLITAASALGGAEIRSATDMAAQLEPTLGSWAGRAFAIGFAAAGISSAVTAPLAAAYATLDVLGGVRSVRSTTARSVWGGTLLIGAAVSLSGVRPVPLIFSAQVLNGLLLPIVAVVLLVAMNDRRRLGVHVNSWRGNLAAGIVVILCTVLGVRTVLLAL